MRERSVPCRFATPAEARDGRTHRTWSDDGVCQRPECRLLAARIAARAAERSAS